MTFWFPWKGARQRLVILALSAEERCFELFEVTCRRGTRVEDVLRELSTKLTTRALRDQTYAQLSGPSESYPTDQLLWKLPDDLLLAIPEGKTTRDYIDRALPILNHPSIHLVCQKVANGKSSSWLRAFSLKNTDQSSDTSSDYSWGVRALSSAEILPAPSSTVGARTGRTVLKT